MGSVYRAHDRRIDRVVALKLTGGSSPAPHVRARLVREGQILSRLAHPGIVSHVDHGLTEEGEPFVAMEWLKGENLQQRLARQPLGLEDALVTLRRIAEALAYAHAHGVIHCDVKPGNLVLVDGDLDRIKLIDFGIACCTGAVEDESRASGTPGFMPPEIIRGRGRPDPRIDVFALACVLVQCLTGRQAFGGEHPMAIQAKVLLDEVTPLGRRHPAIPGVIDEIVARMLAKDPRDRTPDVATVLSQIEGLGRDPERRAGHRPPSLSRGEQRWVSVLVACCSETSDSAAETFTAEVAPSTPDLDDILRPLGADAHRLADGSLVVRFEGDDAATDEASRVARTALAIRARSPGLQLVIATGRSEASGRVPVGEVIDRAVALARRETRPTGGAAMPILLDEWTAALLETRFDIGRDGAELVLLGGREQLAPTRTLLGRPTPFVGRARILGHLEAIIEDCLEEGAARATLITAPPGAGKSRICAELLRRVSGRAGVEVWIGQGEILGAGAAYGLLAQLIKRSLGVREVDAPSWRRSVLRARLARHFTGEPLQRVTEFLGEMTGVFVQGPISRQLAAARREPQLMADHLRWAWLDWCRAMAETSRPLIIVLDDLQWGDLASIKAIDAALRELADRPLMVLALGREEVHQHFPRLWSERGCEHLELGPLSQGARERLVRSVLPHASAASASQVAEQSAGNAFFLEELIRAAAAGSEEAPTTVLAMVHDRLQRLPQPERRLLRAASIFGDRFLLNGALELLGDAEREAGASAVVDALVEGELIAPAREPRSGDPMYVFRHSLVRETAYATLTRRDLLVGHRLAGEWLESRDDVDPTVLAKHFERGGRPERALVWRCKSARAALSAAELETVVTAAEAGVQYGVAGEERRLLRLMQAEALGWLGRYSDVRVFADDLMADSRPGESGWFRAIRELGQASSRIADRGHLVRLTRALLATLPVEADIELFVRAGEPLFIGLSNLGEHELAEELRAVMRRYIGRCSPPVQAFNTIFVERRYHGGIQERLYRQLVAHYRAIGDRRRLLQCEMNHGFGLTMIGQYEAAEEQLRRALARAHELSLPILIPHARANLGLALGLRGELESAAELERSAIAGFVRHSDHRQAAMAHGYLADILIRARRWDDAEEVARAGVAATEKVESQRSFALAVLSHLLRETQRTTEALAAAREAMLPLISGNGFIEDVEPKVRLAYVEVLFAAGHVDEARGELQAARDYVESGIEHVERVEWRAAYLERVPENRRILELCRVHLEGRARGR